MKESEIKEEIISIDIEINTLFYMPGEIIKGIINLNPGNYITEDKNTFELTLKLIQYEFWEYSNQTLEELKNIYKTEIQTKTIYKYSIITENKEQPGILSIPFELEIDKNNDKLLPTFQFEDKDYFLGIRHILTIECKKLNIKNHHGLFIGKNMNINYKDKKQIEEGFIVGFGKINIRMVIPKQSFYFGENVDFTLKVKCSALLKTIKEVEENLYRKIEWKGYLKNSVLEKKNLQNNNFSYNENTFEIYHLIKSPIIPIEECYDKTKKGLIKGVNAPINSYFKYKSESKIFLGVSILATPIFGLVGTVGGLFYGVYKGIKKQFKYLGDTINEPEKKNIYIVSKSDLSYNNYEEVIRDNNINESNTNIEEEILKEIKKFVYFKEDKIIGFTKFPEDITPPIDGYYFKCNYYLKIEVHSSGIARNVVYVNNKIDFYDGYEYIKKMKFLLSIK